MICVKSGTLNTGSFIKWEALYYGPSTGAVGLGLWPVEFKEISYSGLEIFNGSVFKMLSGLGNLTTSPTTYFTSVSNIGLSGINIQARAIGVGTWK